MAAAVTADPEFTALADRMGVGSRAKGLQNAITGWLLRHDLTRELDKQNMSPLLTPKLLADDFVQELYQARLDELRDVSRKLDGPALRGLAVLNPRVYFTIAAAAGHAPPLSAIGELIDDIMSGESAENGDMDDSGAFTPDSPDYDPQTHVQEA